MNLFIKKLSKYFGLERIVHKPKEYITGSSKILELKYGHFKSLKEQQAVRSDGKPIPWFTYPAIEYLEQLDFAGKTMLEWGSGNSSLFFSQRVDELYSVEHNEGWFSKVKSQGIKNQQIFLCDKQSYSSFPRKLDRKFDIILIDGIERKACSETALKFLDVQGFIILDNSDRHPDISSDFRNNDLIQIDFHGFGPINPYTWTTSVFLRRDVRLKPLSIQPQIPIGGGY